MSRRHGLLTHCCLLGAKRMARVGLAKLASAVLVPAMIVPDQRKKPEPAGRRIEVVSVHGRRGTIEPEMDVEASFRIMRSENAAMIPIATGAVWLATGHTKMRCGFPSLALRVEGTFTKDS